jgi:hypothetical protein
MATILLSLSTLPRNLLAHLKRKCSQGERLRRTIRGEGVKPVEAVKTVKTVKGVKAVKSVESVQQLQRLEPQSFALLSIPWDGWNQFKLHHSTFSILHFTGFCEEPNI